MTMDSPPQPATAPATAPAPMASQPPPSVTSSETTTPSHLTSLEASTAIFLLRDYAKYGLAERIFYHFDLTEALSWSKESSGNNSNSNSISGGAGGTGSGSGSGDAAEGANQQQQQQQQQQRRSRRHHHHHHEEHDQIDHSNTGSGGAGNKVCGVVRLLECAPVTSWQRFSSRQKKRLRGRLRSFNERATIIHNAGSSGNNQNEQQQQQQQQQQRTNHDNDNGSTPLIFYQPRALPLRLNPSTRVYFGYETTRIAFCVDASSSLTSTFGSHKGRRSGGGYGGSGNAGGNDAALCPLDRIPDMARIFFSSLVEPISSMDDQWHAKLFVTVLAVFPVGETSETSLLVRDFPVDDIESTQILVDQIDSWVHSEVEYGISERLRRRRVDNPWTVPAYSSSMRHILEAGDYALSVLSSEAKPVMVIATDCRAVSTETVSDVIDRVDVPVHVLDLSLSDTHSMMDDAKLSQEQSTTTCDHEMNFLTYDPGGPSCFPIQLTDDSAAVFSICRSTGGCFFDRCLLLEVATRTAGQQPVNDATNLQHQQAQAHFFRRRFIKMNGLQALTLFAISPLSPTFHSSWGKLPPPFYLQKQFDKSAKEAPLAKALTSPLSSTAISMITDNLDASRHYQRSVIGENLTDAMKRRTNTSHARIIFSRYVVSPVRIKALLLMRVKEGYRTKQYGQSTHDADKVFIQFVLPLEEFGTLHYELSYTAISRKGNLVGSANIKISIEVTNEREQSFVHTVKDQYLQNTPVVDEHLLTIRQKRVSRLCNLLRYIRRNDLLQSTLIPPPAWSDQLVAPDTPFVKRLNGLTLLQRKLNFQATEFDVVCSGGVPYGDIVSYDGLKDLVDAVSGWADQVLAGNTRFVKSFGGSIINYSVIQIYWRVSQLVTVRVECFCDTNPADRLQMVSSLKNAIVGSTQDEVLSKQMAPYLLGTTRRSYVKIHDVENTQFHHASWIIAGLDKAATLDLRLLLTKRRIEIGEFKLLEWDSDYALFAKLEGDSTSPGDLVQYQITIGDKVRIDCHMESQSGVFHPFEPATENSSKFRKMVNIIKRRDQECGRALRSRSALLRCMDVDSRERYRDYQEDYRPSIKRIISYSSRVHRKLRFFHSAQANDILLEMGSNLLLSQSLGVRSTKLPIDPSDLIGEEDAGFWFLLKYDGETMSLVHLSLEDNREEEFVYRSLIFFTTGISDLYTKRDDLADDLGDDESIGTQNEHRCVSQFVERFETAYAKVYASAAYLALRHTSDENDDIGVGGDLDEAIKTCVFVEVSSVLVAGSSIVSQAPAAAGGDSKLLTLIKSVLSPVPGCSGYFYYSGILTGSGATDDEDDYIIFYTSDAVGGNGARAASGDSSSAENDPPIFVRFRLDGEVADANDLSRFSRSSVLAAEVSLFPEALDEDSFMLLPLGHQSFAREISKLLKSFVAEQTLERLKGALMSEDNLILVRKCLDRAMTSVLLSVDIYFFISKRDAMVPASAPAGGEGEVEMAYRVLETELRKNGQFDLIAAPGGDYFVSQLLGESDLPAFWVRISIERDNGRIICQTYHPEGGEATRSLTEKLDALLQSCLRRANQQLMLESLHQSRGSSDLLIASEEGAIDANVPATTFDSFPRGSFGCPLVFRTVFDLFHRAATNPKQVVRELEAKVLHSFAISNCPDFFVYKDEEGGIFYMKLNNTETQVELLVYGIDDPGPSITEQLCDLLRRRIMLIGVDLLSSVLTKNPHYKWREGDLEYVHSFEAKWKQLGLESGRSDTSTKFYEFPITVNDPVMVILLLRQNLCGSSFFHRLNDMDQDGSNPSPSISIGSDLASGGKVLCMNGHEFTLYYNNAPSKLDPAFQGVSTLTEKGAEYCRQVGSGIAIVEVSLVNKNGYCVEHVSFAAPAFPNADPLSKDDLRMRETDSISIHGRKGSTFLKLRIIDTALQRSALFDWIHLTLNQALIAWTSERVLRHPSESLLPSKDDTERVSSSKQRNHLVRLCPGLPVFEDILLSSFELPHPDVKRVQSLGVVRASSVATLTLELLDNCILFPIVEMLSLKLAPGLEKVKSNLKTIRLSRNSRPRVVNLQRMSSKSSTISVLSNDGRKMQDSPIECPEYICFFSLTGSHGGDAQLYREIAVHDGISERSSSIKLLESIKEQNPSVFSRSLAFVFAVKRNVRSLLLYNANPALVEKISSLFMKAEETNLASVDSENTESQLRALKKVLSPACADTDKDPKAPTPKSTTEVVAVAADPIASNATTSSGPTKRIRRPTAIRRPKLIGKSIEGSAMQAVAASRNRARTNQFRSAKPTPPAVTKKPIQSEIIRPKPKLNTGTNGQGSYSLKSPGPAAATESAPRLLNTVTLDLSKLRSVDFSFRLSSIICEAQLQLGNFSLPVNPACRIPLPLTNSMSSLSPAAWSDVCRLPPVPESIVKSFIPLFGRWISSFNNDFYIMSTSVDSIILRSGIKNVHGSKCLALVQLSTSARSSSMIVRSNGWILKLPRRTRSKQKQKPFSNFCSSYQLNKDSAGMDRILADTHAFLSLESVLFDFCASVIERSARLLDNKVPLKEIAAALQELILLYPYERQKQMTMLNYRAFTATIVLKSYRDSLIDMFDSKTLFRRLALDSEVHQLIHCGDLLCFKRHIAVKGTQSIAFLRINPTEPAKMELLLLCKAKGQNLGDFMFREGSNVAIHILDNIGIEAGGLAYGELHDAAESLMRDRLWKSFSAIDLHAPEQETFRKMLEIVHVDVLMSSKNDSLGGGNCMSIGSAAELSEGIAFLMDSEMQIDWHDVIVAMKREKIFSPNFNIAGLNGIDAATGCQRYIFYLSRPDVFLMLGVDLNSSLLVRVDIVSRDRNPERRQSAMETFLNFVLSFLWQGL